MKTPSISKNVANNILDITHENLDKEISFTQEYIDNQWKIFLNKIDSNIYNAIFKIKLIKDKENKIIIRYPSDASLTKFKENQPIFFKQFEQNNIELFFEKQTYIPKKQENPLDEFSKLKKENQLFQELDDFFQLEIK